MSHSLLCLFACIHSDDFFSDVTSENSAITFNVYDRAVSDLGFLGTLQIKPVLVHEHSVDQWYKYVFPLAVPDLAAIRVF